MTSCVSVFLFPFLLFHRSDLDLFDSRSLCFITFIRSFSLCARDCHSFLSVVPYRHSFIAGLIPLSFLDSTILPDIQPTSFLHVLVLEEAADLRISNSPVCPGKFRDAGSCQDAAEGLFVCGSSGFIRVSHASHTSTPSPSPSPPSPVWQ